MSPTVTRTRPAAARKPSAAASEPRTSLTPETWIDAATAVLVDQGIDSVRVDVLATQLKVTRGSFYWHFRDREDLLRRVLQTWSEHTTELLTRRLETARTDPREQLRDVISLPFRGRAAARAARIELAIRAWARRDDTARQFGQTFTRRQAAAHDQLAQAQLRLDGLRCVSAVRHGRSLGLCIQAEY